MAGRLVGHSRVLAVPVRAVLPAGTQIAVVGKVRAVVVRRLLKVTTSEGDKIDRKDHTFTMTRETLFHHAVKYGARFDETLIH